MIFVASMVMRYLSSIFLLCLSILALSQNGTNPLDIEGRTPDAEILEDSTVVDALRAFESSQEPSDDSEIINPFDVSHIPLKKSEISTSSSSSSSDSILMGFLFWVMIILLIGFSAIMFFFRDKVSGMIRPILNNNLLKSMNRDENGGKNPFSLSLYLFFVLNLGVFIYLFLSNKKLGLEKFQLWIATVLVIIGLYAVKHAFIYFIKWVYPLGKPLSDYGYAIVIYNGILGIFLFPLNLLMVFGSAEWMETFLKVGFFIIIAWYLARLIKGFLLSSRLSTKHLLHFFLYLCGSEIAPIAMVFGFFNHGF